MLRKPPPPRAHQVDVFIHDERGDPLIITRLEAIMNELEDLRREVAESRGVTESAITLLQGLKQKLDEAIASGDPAALAQLSADLDSQTNRLADAVQANSPTPSEPPPPPPAEPPVEPA